MESLAEKIERITSETGNKLKDFQAATVERVIQLFENGQDRILVADEVGLGKTMIAKGVIAYLAKHRFDNGLDHFKVFYVCSNQSIARKNISELDVFENGCENISDTRLSMLHLMIEKNRLEDKDRFTQLIPLTPQTSFNQKSGRGIVNERALIFCILKRLDQFDRARKIKLCQMMRYRVREQSWDTSVKHYDCEIDSLVKNPLSNYLTKIHSQLLSEKATLTEVLAHIDGRNSTDDDGIADGDLYCISRLRKLFARISVMKMKPDLVIMDEFQNFRYLLNSTDVEISTLAECFFNGNHSGQGTRILLLSATPYKLYTTLEEISDTNTGDHYREFIDVMKFLFHEKGRFSEFNDIWQKYSMALKELNGDRSSMLILQNRTKEAGDKMYGAVCRTERLSVMDNAEFLDDSSRYHPLTIGENDIKAYLQAASLMRVLKRRFRMDYIKSCPYPLSFMNNYIEKNQLRDYFKEHPEQINMAKKNLLWINKHKINDYQPLPAVNARFEQLKNKTFQHDSALLLWMPPCCPYYSPYGVYAGYEDFSKILIFSSWEMVPRMIGSLISYEEERRTIGELIKKHNDSERTIRTYFMSDSEKKKRKRYPSARLRASVLPVLTLMYPSSYLAYAYDPIRYLADGVEDVKKIEACVKEKIHKSLARIVGKIARKNGKTDRRWYHLAPMMLDDPGNVVTWIDCMLKDCGNEADMSTYQVNGEMSLSAILSRIRKFFIGDGTSYSLPAAGSLGRIPEDLEDVMTAVAMASPAVCLFRALKDAGCATRISQDFIRYFNSPESTAIVELACSKRRKPKENSHWRYVLKYCHMGNIQAMIDEFIHLIRRKASLSEDMKEIECRFHDSLTLHSSQYNVESYFEFHHSVIKGLRKSSGKKFRTHYGAGFSKGDETEQDVARKDSLRNAFNSPFWPFVLASTSIGQEGLDFHLYCRKIMHWNLPSNPVDLEQREGRINRFKCLAIRQNIAHKYVGEIRGKKDDCWEELFDAAVAERKEGQSELVPYWCFGENQTVKIERILPLYPFSKDTDSYDRLVKVLSLYRLTLGQARQEDLLDHVFKNFDNPEFLKELFIDLSPYAHKKL